MAETDDMLHDVGAQLAGVAPQPPAVLHAAAKAAFHASLGSPDAAAVVASQGDDPEVRALLGAAFALLKKHPEFWRQFYLQQSRLVPLPDDHPWTPTIDAVAAATPTEIDPSTAVPSPAMTTGYARGRRAMPGGPGLAHPGVDATQAQGGIYGWGARYILDEQEQLGDVHNPMDGEPERIAHAGTWMGD